MRYNRFFFFFSFTDKKPVVFLTSVESTAFFNFKHHNSSADPEEHRSIIPLLIYSRWQTLLKKNSIRPLSCRYPMWFWSISTRRVRRIKYLDLFLSFILDSRLYFIPRPTCYSVWESSALGPRGPESSPMTRCYKQKHHFQEGRYKRVRKHPTQCRSILCMDPSLYAIRCRILAVWKRSVGYHWLRQLDSLEHAHLCRSPLSRFHHLQSIQVCPSFPIIS